MAWLAENRFPTVRALSRSLEEVTLRAEGVEDRNPFPGLSAFTESDAEYFFGREAEVEALGKIDRIPARVDAFMEARNSWLAGKM